MNCPHCNHHLAAACQRCDACGFEMAWLLDVLGDGVVKMEKLSDRAHCLRLADSQRLLQQIEQFQAHFPQVFIAVYFAVLPQTLSPNELTFWLLNHAAFDSEDAERQNEFAMILLVDPVAKAVALNVGYALERLLPDSFLQSVLRGMRTPLWHAEYIEGVEDALQKLAARLRGSARRVEPTQEISPPESAGEFMRQAGFDPLKRTHVMEELQRDLNEQTNRW